jgi:hypothetical protein
MYLYSVPQFVAFTVPIYDKVAYIVPISYAQCHDLYPCTTGSGTYSNYVQHTMIYTVPIYAQMQYSCR